MMIDDDKMEILYHASCQELSEICTSLKNNGGHFKSSQQIDDTKDCVEIIKNLKKLSGLMR